MGDRSPGCQTRRIDVLRQTNRQQATVSKDGCDVTSGLWFDAYTGTPIHDPRDIIVDHLIDPREADESGAWRWPPARKKAFFDDPHNLAIVSRQQSREKQGRDPAQWLPADAGVKCDYCVVRWVELKRTYGLTVDHAEARKLVSAVEECVKQQQR